MYIFKVVSFYYRYEMPQYGSRRRLLPPAEEYGEVVAEAEEGIEEEEVNPIVFLYKGNVPRINFNPI